MSDNDLDATTPNQDGFLSLTIVIKIKTKEENTNDIRSSFFYNHTFVIIENKSMSINYKRANNKIINK